MTNSHPNVLLETPHLTMRPWRLEDREVFHALNVEPDVQRYLSPLMTADGALGAGGIECWSTHRHVRDRTCELGSAIWTGRRIKLETLIEVASQRARQCSDIFAIDNRQRGLVETGYLVTR